MIQRNEQTFQNMCTLFGLFQLVARPAHHYIMPVIHEVYDQITKVQRLWTPLYQRNVIDAE